MSWLSSNRTLQWATAVAISKSALRPSQVILQELTSSLLAKALHTLRSSHSELGYGRSDEEVGRDAVSWSARRLKPRHFVLCGN
jgi:hypothetical protein